MALHSSFLNHKRLQRASHSKALHRVVTTTAKTSKGFGSVRKQDAHEPKVDSRLHDDKRILTEATAAITSHRPVRPEEAARGKLDYVQVADWGDGDRSKLGELRLVSHVQQYEGGAADGGDDTAAAAAGGDGGRRKFHFQLAHQLRLAEARGALAVAGPVPPPVSEWSFSEGRYCQYLTDQLEVHSALEAALTEATSAGAAITSTATVAVTTTTEAAGSDAGSGATPSPEGGPAAAEMAAQDAVVALCQVAPGRLGLERSAAIRRDLAALRATKDHPAALEARRAAAAGLEAATPATTIGRGNGGHATSKAPPPAQARSSAAPSAAAAATQECTAGPMARSYAQMLRRLGHVVAAGESEKERQVGALRLLAHCAVLHLVAQAVWVRLGATATERLALLQRGAAATYHEYPQQVTDPRVTLARALDAAGEHLRGPAARQIVFDEVAGAMQKTGLLLSALARRD